MLVGQTVNEYIKKIENANLLESTDIDKSLSIYLDLWNALPNPKNKQPRQLSNWLIDCIFGVYFDKKDYVKAKEWAIEALNNDTAETGSDEYFQMGRVCYELEEYDEAMKYFSIAYERGKNGLSKNLIKNTGNFILKTKNK